MNFGCANQPNKNNHNGDGVNYATTAALRQEDKLNESSTKAQLNRRRSQHRFRHYSREAGFVCSRERAFEMRDFSPEHAHQRLAATEIAQLALHFHHLSSFRTDCQRNIAIKRRRLQRCELASRRFRDGDCSREQSREHSQTQKNRAREHS